MVHLEYFITLGQSKGYKVWIWTGYDTPAQKRLSANQITVFLALDVQQLTTIPLAHYALLRRSNFYECVIRCAKLSPDIPNTMCVIKNAVQNGVM